MWVPRGYGFAYQWLFFSAAKHHEFRLRYLGRLDGNGGTAVVVAFKQDPDKVEASALFQSAEKVASFYYQGRETISS